MEAAGQVAGTVGFNVAVFKEPRGFIKPIQWILSIFAFATTVGVHTDLVFNMKFEYFDNATNQSFGHVARKIEYPFNLEALDSWIIKCNTSSVITTLSFSLLQGSKSSAEFFVFVGVIVFLYCLAALVVYIFLDNVYRRSNTFPIADFIVSAVIVLLWLISSSAWAQGVSDVKYYTDLERCGVFNKMRTACAGSISSFQETVSPNFASLNVSVIFGFLNMLVWGGNLWFLWKETPWSKMQSKPATMSGQEQGNQKI
ncbi:hypothetical protein ACJMK2_016408 [Sinanodonta woodiana]|uniref:MARVEL domain-containing protein n=1 Tax=Sinanodonta woodiana TaxID=1069815 RepID=A0ABD3UUC3_SINWO